MNPTQKFRLEEYFSSIKNLKENYSDEIPKEILHSTMIIDGKIVNPKYKCRKGWFQGLYSYIEMGIDLKVINGKSKELYKNFCTYLKETEMQKRLTTQEDITKANELLTSVIKDLEQIISSEQQKP